MGITERAVHIKNLIALKDFCNNNGAFTLANNIEQSLDYAISSLKTDLKYDLMYEGEEIYTKTDTAAILKELEYELYHALCHEIHGKEDCPCTNQTTSCLATFRVCDANRAIYKVIQEKINALKEN